MSRNHPMKKSFDYCSLRFWKKFKEKIANFDKFCCQPPNLRLGPCLAMCLKFFRFEAGRAYELCAYKEKNV